MSDQTLLVFGVPTFNHASKVRQAIQSILDQTERRIAVVVTDEGSNDGTWEILTDLAATDSRLIVKKNPMRMGYLENANQTLRIATQMFPGAKYFAWGSDHDVWEPEWAEKLIAALERNPRAVFAWPQVKRIDENGEEIKTRLKEMETDGVKCRKTRLLHTARNMSAGNMVYGLFSMDAIRSAGGLERTIIPDQLLFLELALLGEFCQVKETLWNRRYRGLASKQRQRRNLFAGKPPLYTYLPVTLIHCTLLVRFSARAALRGWITKRPIPGALAGYFAFAAHRMLVRDWRKRAIRLLRDLSPDVYKNRTKRIIKLIKGY